MELLSYKYPHPSAEDYTHYLPSMGLPEESATEMPRLYSKQRDEQGSIYVRRLDDIKLLKYLYNFNNPVKEVEIFLLAHTPLITLLFETDKYIKQIFGENRAEVWLEIVIDPEEDFEGMFAVVKTNTSPKKSLDLLDQFYEEWFLDNVPSEINSIFYVTARPI